MRQRLLVSLVLLSLLSVGCRANPLTVTPVPTSTATSTSVPVPPTSTPVPPTPPTLRPLINVIEGGLPEGFVWVPVPVTTGGRGISFADGRSGTNIGQDPETGLVHTTHMPAVYIEAFPQSALNLVAVDTEEVTVMVSLLEGRVLAVMQSTGNIMYLRRMADGSWEVGDWQSQ